MKKSILAILLATIWISISEFVRNEFLFKSYWTYHYESLGLVFPSEPVNGAVWGLWSLCFALAIYFIAKKFSLWEILREFLVRRIRADVDSYWKHGRTAIWDIGFCRSIEFSGSVPRQFDHQESGVAKQVITSLSCQFP